MTTAEFLSHLRSLNVQVWADGEHLRCNAPKQVLTPNLQAELQERKQEILHFLRESAPRQNPSHAASWTSPRSVILATFLRTAEALVFRSVRRKQRGLQYHQSNGIRGPLNVAVLQRSIRSIVERHEVLRTTFAQSNGVPVQVISNQSAESDNSRYQQTPGERVRGKHSEGS